MLTCGWVFTPGRQVQTDSQIGLKSQHSLVMPEDENSSGERKLSETGIGRSQDRPRMEWIQVLETWSTTGPGVYRRDVWIDKSLKPTLSRLASAGQ
jgi:hypothetical protein